MYYFADGDQSLIRVDSTDRLNTKAFYDAPAQRYLGAKLGWVGPTGGNNMPSQATNSGDYYQVDEAEAQRVMSVIDAYRVDYDRRRSAAAPK